MTPEMNQGFTNALDFAAGISLLAFMGFWALVMAIFTLPSPWMWWLGGLLRGFTLTEVVHHGTMLAIGITLLTALMGASSFIHWLVRSRRG